MIATCLWGEALEVFKTLDMESRLNLDTVKNKLFSAFKPEDTKFTSLSKFQSRSLHPSETPQKYLYELKGLLRKTFPEMSMEAKEQLLFEQYIRGLPRQIFENIRLSPDIITSEGAMKRAQILIRLQNESSGRLEGEINSVKAPEEFHVEENLMADKVYRKLVNEAVKQITERFSILACNENENSICAVDGRRNQWRNELKGKVVGYERSSPRGYE